MPEEENELILSPKIGITFNQVYKIMFIVDKADNIIQDVSPETL